MPRPVLYTLIRFIVPMTLIIVSLVRPVGISFLYLLMFFISPWVLKKQSHEQLALLNIFIIVLCILSITNLIGHVLINLTNFFFFETSAKTSTDIIFRQIGFLYFKGLSLGSIAHWILPDIIVFLVTLVSLIFFKIFNKKQKKQNVWDNGIIKESQEQTGTLKVTEMNRMLIIVYIRSVLRTSPIFTLIVLYFAATLRPSLPGSLYFLMFIIAGTYWALYRQVHRGMYYPLIFMVVALFFHIIFICAYQLPILQESIHINSIWTRVMGMEVLLSLYDENKNGKIVALNVKLHLDSYLSPIALMLAYFVSTLSLLGRSQYELTLNAIRLNLEPHSNDVSTHTQNINGKNAEIYSDAVPSMLEQFFYMVFDVTSIIYKNSYILLNIIMMVNIKFKD
nr:piezo-type mechanosensitive ion channel component-like [Drosophila kikkawai]